MKKSWGEIEAVIVAYLCDLAHHEVAFFAPGIGWPNARDNGEDEDMERE